MTLGEWFWRSFKYLGEGIHNVKEETKEEKEEEKKELIQSPKDEPGFYPE